VVVQIRPSCDATYPSDIEPWTEWMTGKQGQSPNYDPLAPLKRPTSHLPERPKAITEPLKAKKGDCYDLFFHRLINKWGRRKFCEKIISKSVRFSTLAFIINNIKKIRNA
jgi:hypothetical protein